MKRSMISATAIVALAGAFVPAGAAQSASAAGQAIHVAVGGSDRASGTSQAPLATIQAAVDAAVPGTVIKVHAGTYKGEVKIRKSGTPTAPITLTNAGDGEVVVTSDQAPDSCTSHQPSMRRTIKITGGASDWTIRGLTIVHGLLILGEKSTAAFNWHATKVKERNWADRRKVPGRGQRDPSSTHRVIPYLQGVTGARSMASADRIRLYGNKIRSRGIHASLSNYGVIQGNVISDIICGSGPGVWVMTFSDHWTIADNDISRLSAASTEHYMHEGIRLGTASNYNYVARNSVHDLPGDGRAYNTDVDSSYNLFQFNRANKVAIGFNEQMAGWGNTWEYNAVTNFRVFGYGLRLKDAKLPLPSMDTSTNGVIMRCNRAFKPVGKAKSLGVGAVMNARLNTNAFTTIWFSPASQTYWSRFDNRWNGSTQLPDKDVTPSYCG
ncbi:exported hypothetical protein [Nostocoides australiense Ben110]|uniref:DUF1565 domain-containing protein n=1 Tax=Nostocoides australiense Ben110 TaxID=1193182 RepID=W6K4Q0_9MICO|nr:DUF1565 domain-containing protein [Tetrasphaera australiensis]CCH75399.1 exported hypothetical protein [Tetrasphaera australiensis Ben110]